MDCRVAVFSADKKSTLIAEKVITQYQHGHTTYGLAIGVIRVCLRVATQYTM